MICGRRLFCLRMVLCDAVCVAHRSFDFKCKSLQFSGSFIASSVLFIFCLDFFSMSFSLFSQHLFIYVCVCVCAWVCSSFEIVLLVLF